MTDSPHWVSGQVVVAPVWVVRNKVDLELLGAPAGTWRGAGQGGDFRISASRGDGIPELVQAIAAFARDYFGSQEDSLIGRLRQRELLLETARSLHRSIAVAGRGEELVAEELRSASHSLGRLMGRVDVEDVLDVIFREFCVGK
jgi:tRNA modification GTPase